MAIFDYDLFVIGAGSGGVRAARMAAQHGAKVAVAEEYRIGGTCVIRGCVPKKLLVYASRFAEEFEDSSGFGWTVGETGFSWETLIRNKDREIARLEGLYRAGMEAAKVKDVFADRATLTAPHQIRLERAGKTFSARHVLIATGARPFTPDIPGKEHTITSNEAFHLKALPKRIVISGGGYIALEFAGIFSGLGSEVTLIYRGEEILRGFDQDVRAALHREMTARGIKILTRRNIEAIAQGIGGKEVLLSDKTEIEADEVMCATGRVPNVDGLGLAAAGIALDPEKGGIRIKETLRFETSLAAHHAIGDVTNRLNLTPVAIRDGQAFADTVFGGGISAVDTAMTPTAVFSTPEVGTVGLTEEAAAGRGGAGADIYIAEFRPMKATLSGRATKMLMKLIVDRADQRVLGCHIVGEGAGEMVQIAAIALRAGLTKAAFDATIALHPSAAEELVLMKKPARKAGGG